MLCGELTMDKSPIERHFIIGVAKLPESTGLETTMISTRPVRKSARNPYAARRRYQLSEMSTFKLVSACVVSVILLVSLYLAVVDPAFRPTFGRIVEKLAAGLFL